MGPCACGVAEKRRRLARSLGSPSIHDTGLVTPLDLYARRACSKFIDNVGTRPGVVFHDFMPLRGSGIVSTVRENFTPARIAPASMSPFGPSHLHSSALNIISWLRYRQ